MRLSPSLPDLTVILSASDPNRLLAPDSSAQPLSSQATGGSLSPTSPADLPPLSPSTTISPSSPNPNCSPLSSPRIDHPANLDADSAPRLGKAAAASNTCVRNKLIGRVQARKDAILDMPPLLKRTGHARRFPRSISVDGGELTRDESCTETRARVFPASQSLSGRKTAAEARRREEVSSPGGGSERGDARGDGDKEGEAGTTSVDDGSAGYDSDEEFVKLYGMVAEHRAAERAIVSSAFARVLSRPHSGTCSPKVATGSCSSTIIKSGSGCSSIIRSGSGCISNVRFVSGNSICTSTCDVAAANEDEGRFRVPGGATVLVNHRFKLEELPVRSPRGAALGPRFTIKGTRDDVPCTNSGSRPRVSLDSAVAVVATIDGDGRELAQRLKESECRLVSQQRQGQHTLSLLEEPPLQQRLRVDVGYPMGPTSAKVSPARKGLKGSNGRFPRSASESGPCPTGMAQRVRQASGNLERGKCLSPQASGPAEYGANSHTVRHLKPCHRRQVSSSAIAVNSLC
ncbi:hypothetical protein CLOP_g24948 [Closterium sp. NIES-67]|nr:hypothetical protein CLOP_g24948 [Closterium sp. NIES-67]